MTLVDFLPAAQRDLAAIFLYTEVRYGRAQADRYVCEIADSCNLIAEGRRRPCNESRVGAGLFSHGVKAHRIDHRRRADGGLIVVRMLHGRMNREDHL